MRVIETPESPLHEGKYLIEFTQEEIDALIDDIDQLAAGAGLGICPITMNILNTLDNLSKEP